MDKKEARYWQDKLTLDKNADNSGRFTKQDLQILRILPVNYKKWKKWFDANERENEQARKKSNIDSSIKNQVLEKFAAKKFGEASEILVKHVLKTEYIYTTRSDIKPEIWHYEEGIYVPEGRSFLKEYLRETMGEAYSSFVYKIVIDKIEADTFIDIDKFFGKENIEEIPVKNGILNIFNKELKPFNPNKIFFNKLPIEYNPNAKCPAIKEFFKTILKEEEDSKLIFELIGFCLMKEYRFEKGFMFIGNGRNGKSKTLSLMKRFLGAENCSGIPLSQLKSESSSVCELKNRLVNLAGDLSNTDLKDTGMFKNLTGRDLITAKRKYLRDLIFENYAKMVFACNELPRVYDTSKGFWSRWILLEFPYEFIPEYEYNKLTEKERFMKKIENPSIIDLITTDSELSGLLNESLISLDNLLNNKKFSYTKGATEIKDLWIRMSNSFMAFCMDCLEENPDHYILKKDLRLIFSKYCKSHKIRGAGDKDIKSTLGDLFGAIDSRKMIRTEEDNIVLNVWEGVNFNIDRVVSFFPKVSSYIYKGGLA